MKKNHFFAMLFRMKYIIRWQLMCNTRIENDSEHSLEVAYIAHALGVINNTIYKGDLNAERLALLGMYHDATEIITGDMPTPVKYYSKEIRKAYTEVENVAKEQLLTGLPEEMQGAYAPLLGPSKEEEKLWIYVKAADKISALIKCIEEEHKGNHDFDDAKDTISAYIEKIDLPEVKYYMKHFMPAFSMTLDKSGTNRRKNV